MVVDVLGNEGSPRPLRRHSIIWSLLCDIAHSDQFTSFINLSSEYITEAAIGICLIRDEQEI